MLGYLWRTASNIFARPPRIEPKVAGWYGIQAVTGKRAVGWVDYQPFSSRDQVFREELIPLEGQYLSELLQYPELVALLMSQGENQLPDRRIWL